MEECCEIVLPELAWHRMNMLQQSLRTKIASSRFSGGGDVSTTSCHEAL